MSANEEDLKQEIEDLKTAQATQTATQAGAQATQAATQAGTWSTMTASQAGLMTTMAAGFVSLIVGTFLGLSIANSR
jgi:predicted lipid-binding transport protein (Tim44 family)